MESLKRNKTLLWILGVLVALGVAVMLYKHFRTDPVDATLAQPVSGETVITGTFACLPLKSGVEITQENCVMGIAADGPTDAYANKMYALNSSQVSIMSRTIGTQDRVRVVGKLVTPDTTVDEGNAFKIDGIIEARAIQHAPAQQ